MVSPGKLRAVRELRDDERDAFEPSIDETGTVTYPFADRHVDEGDGRAVDVLEELADRGVLSSEFEHKVYVCPNCATEGMQYSTGCPHCGSVHAVREPAVVHPACGRTLGADRRDEPGETDGEDAEPRAYCPGCDEEVPTDDLEHDERYRCRECDSWFGAAVHRLWCRGCSRVYPPAETREESLYRYPLTSAGTQWVTEQVEARRSLVETLEARGYETSVDATVETASGGQLPVHVSAEDDLLDDRIVADVHESPTTGDVRRLLEAAGAVGARPMVLLTTGSVDERVAGLLDAEDVMVVSATDDGFSREYAVGERSDGTGRLLDRLGSLFSPGTGR